MNLYQDRWIECTDEEIRIRGYYFPWGTKRIRYGDIRSVERVNLSAFRGKGRIWGSGDFRHWLNLDPDRPKKSVGFSLDLGRRVVPFITPEDPDVVEEIIAAHR